MTAIVTIQEHAEVLRSTSEEVSKNEITSPKIQKIIQDMSRVLSQTQDGIGIAAPQIGIPLRIFLASEEALFERDEDTRPEKKKNEWQHFVFINPKIVKSSKEFEEGPEGCLSVPNTYGVVKRKYKVRVRAYDAKGKVFERGSSGLFARLLQHEIDHLNGTIFIDHAKEITHSRE